MTVVVARFSPYESLTWRDGVVTAENPHSPFLSGLELLDVEIEKYPEGPSANTSQYREDPYVFIEAVKLISPWSPTVEGEGLYDLPPGETLVPTITD
jgi:hypothetical protein